MADTPMQDRKAGLPRKRVGGRFVTAYSADRALDICVQIAEGKTLSQVCKMDGMPHRTTFNRWVNSYPDLREAYFAARELSAYALEDEALDAARELRSNPGTSQQVRAIEVLLNQLRWSMAKRNKPEFSEKAAVNVTVPIQINTPLDLNTEGGTGTKQHPNIYEVEAKVEQEAEPSEGPFVDLNATQPKPKGKRGGYEERRKRDEQAQKDLRTNFGKVKRQ